MRSILPGSRLNARSSCLTSLRASVSSNRSSHSLRTVSWRKAIYNTTLILPLASVTIRAYSNISYPLFHTIVRFLLANLTLLLIRRCTINTDWYVTTYINPDYSVTISLTFHSLHIVTTMLNIFHAHWHETMDMRQLIQVTKHGQMWKEMFKICSIK